MKRMWINQPSTLQPLHHLHGTNVLAQEDRIWFLTGEVISQQVPPNVLSEGWRNDGPLEIRELLVISTAHVSAETATLLNQTKDMHWPVLGGHYNEYGWFIYAGLDWHGQGQVPDDLFAVMRFAQKKGCLHILFDRDADAIDGLPTYEW